MTQQFGDPRTFSISVQPTSEVEDGRAYVVECVAAGVALHDSEANHPTSGHFTVELFRWTLERRGARVDPLLGGLPLDQIHAHLRTLIDARLGLDVSALAALLPGAPAGSAYDRFARFELLDPAHRWLQPGQRLDSHIIQTRFDTETILVSQRPHSRLYSVETPLGYADSVIGSAAGFIVQDECEWLSRIAVLSHAEALDRFGMTPERAGMVLDQYGAIDRSEWRSGGL
jgi:hypothetical protein